MYKMYSTQNCCSDTDESYHLSLVNLSAVLPQRVFQEVGTVWALGVLYLKAAKSKVSECRVGEVWSGWGLFRCCNLKRNSRDQHWQYHNKITSLESVRLHVGCRTSQLRRKTAYTLTVTTSSESLVHIRLSLSLIIITGVATCLNRQASLAPSTNTASLTRAKCAGPQVGIILTGRQHKSHCCQITYVAAWTAISYQTLHGRTLQINNGTLPSAEP